MLEVLISLLERIGILLIIAFLIMKAPHFRYLLDYEAQRTTYVYYTMIFGLFGMIGTYAGTVITEEQLVSAFWLPRITDGQILAPVTIVSVIFAALLGGPMVGIGSAIIAGVHLMWFDTTAGIASGLAVLITGFVASYTYRFIVSNHIIHTARATYLGILSTCIYMILITVLVRPFEFSIDAVTLIAVPMVITNSLAIIILTMMIRTTLNEKELGVAVETGKAFTISEQVLGYLKEGLTPKTAQSIAQMFLKEFRAVAVVVTDTEKILFQTNDFLKEHKIETLFEEREVSQAVSTGTLQVVRKGNGFSALIIPFSRSTHVAGLILLYFRETKHIRSVEIVFAEGLGKLISYQLGLLETEKLRVLLKDTEVRSLQAQINPHFLFNTLNTIVTLIRINPDQARAVMVHLANFMRLNLKLMSSPLVSLEQELVLLESYIKIVEVRFSEQLTIDLLIEDNLTYYKIPPATIQPLLENSIQHGLKKKATGGKVMISIEKTEENGLRVIVSDNGTGIPEDRLHSLAKQQMASKKGTGIGVFNVNQRLMALLGENAQLRIRNLPEAGCEIKFYLPNLNEERGL
ncbi:hypothetical protein BHU72_06885 [Desulfuribacillus stibiiarsenatis]|uniref:Histidine kinase domain-containing protein n=2 Tax=Desulfuribacillus stibiiarsenatis TaxID=1390249 RepID=A0A1E5L4F8_9FIRM|nr:hypothetical protein BHU72_06885 [Desulfuribacillus stibiiarsenatis]